MFGKLAAPIAFVWSHLKEVAGLSDPSEFTTEDFRLELAELGLLGKEFGPGEYRAALEKCLGFEIHIEELPDAEGGALAGRLAAGSMAEVVVDEKTGKAVVLVRKSLHRQPWPAYDLAVYHELSHLAAGHPLRAGRARVGGELGGFRSLSARLARGGLPVGVSEWRRPGSATAKGLETEGFEQEARERAKWLVVAGMCPRAFESEQTDCLT